MELKIDTKVHFNGLKSGVYDYVYNLDDSFFNGYENEKIRGGAVNFDVKMDKKSQLLMFYFSFEGEITTECDRCLGELKVPVSGKETLCVKFSDEELDCEDENTTTLPEKACEIDLGQWMYEYVAVAIPMQCVHPDDENGNPTCDPEMLKYISPNTEEAEEEDSEVGRDNSEVDPRWEILKTLK